MSQANNYSMTHWLCRCEIISALTHFADASSITTACPCKTGYDALILSDNPQKGQRRDYE
jgi:hypothetical protein